MYIYVGQLSAQNCHPQILSLCRGRISSIHISFHLSTNIMIL